MSHFFQPPVRAQQEKGSQQGDEQLGCRNRQPDAVQAPEMRQQQKHRQDHQESPQDGEREGRLELRHGGKGGDRDHVEAHQSEGQEIQVDRPHGKRRQLRRIFLIEQARDLGGEEDARAVKEKPDGSGAGGSQEEGMPDSLLLQRAEICADDRLDALANSVEKSGADNGDIRHDPIGGHARIARKPQNHRVEGEDHDAGGKLCDKVGNTAAENLQDFPALRLHADQAQRIALAQEMRHMNEQAQHSAEPRSHRRAEHAEPERVDENIIQHYIR